MGVPLKDWLLNRHIPDREPTVSLWRSLSVRRCCGPSDRSADARELDVRLLLSGYACRTLALADERRLHLAALDSQDLFDDLAEEDLFREALADEVFRERLKQRLRDLNERSSSRAVADWLNRPSASFALASAALAIVIWVGALFHPQWQGKLSGSLEPTAGPSHAKEFLPEARPPVAAGQEEEPISLERLWNSAEPRRASGVELSLNRPGDIWAYAKGEPMRIAFSVPWDASVVLLSKSPEGVITRLFPDDYRPSIRVRANESVAVMHAGQRESYAAEPMGRHYLRLLVFPVGTDPLHAGASGRIPLLAVERDFLVHDRSGNGD